MSHLTPGDLEVGYLLRLLSTQPILLLRVFMVLCYKNLRANIARKHQYTLCFNKLLARSSWALNRNFKFLLNLSITVILWYCVLRLVLPLLKQQTFTTDSHGKKNCIYNCMQNLSKRGSGTAHSQWHWFPPAPLILKTTLCSTESSFACLKCYENSWEFNIWLI